MGTWVSAGNGWTQRSPESFPFPKRFHGSPHTWGHDGYENTVNLFPLLAAALLETLPQLPTVFYLIKSSSSSLLGLSCLGWAMLLQLGRDFRSLLISSSLAQDALITSFSSDCTMVLWGEQQQPPQRGANRAFSATFNGILHYSLKSLSHRRGLSSEERIQRGIPHRAREVGTATRVDSV